MSKNLLVNSRLLQEEMNNPKTAINLQKAHTYRTLTRFSVTCGRTDKIAKAETRPAAMLSRTGVVAVTNKQVTINTVKMTQPIRHIFIAWLLQQRLTKRHIIIMKARLFINQMSFCAAGCTEGNRFSRLRTANNNNSQKEWTEETVSERVSVNVTPLNTIH